MTEKTPGPIASLLSTKTGLSTAIVTGILSVAVPVRAAAVMHKITYDKRWNAYEDSLPDGTAKLDGKVTEVIDTNAQQAAEDAIYLRGHIVVDATLVSASRWRIRKEEKECARAGESASDIWRGRSGQGRAERQ